MKIKELLAIMDERGLPLVEEDETIQGVLKKMLHYPHTRLMYVVDKEGTCTGVISLGTLIRYLFPRNFEPAVHARFIIPMITAETAKDIMNKGVVSATGEDDLDTVIKRMIKSRVKEIPILDRGKKVVADLTMLDLLQYYHAVPE
jgi:CBS domain-containing protein